MHTEKEEGDSGYEFPSLRSPQAAETLNISEATLWRWNRAGQGPVSYKIGGSRLWRKSDLVAWLENECRQTRAVG